MIGFRNSKRHNSRFEIEDTKVFYSAPIVYPKGDNGKLGNKKKNKERAVDARWRNACSRSLWVTHLAYDALATL